MAGHANKSSYGASAGPHTSEVPQSGLSLKVILRTPNSSNAMHIWDSGAFPVVLTGLSSLNAWNSVYRAGTVDDQVSIVLITEVN